MTKSELIRQLAARHTQLEVSDSEFAVRLILDAMSQSLKEGGRIEIRGFGSFDLHFRPARLGRNPKTGKRVLVTGKSVPHFRMGKELRNGVSTRARPSSLDAVKTVQRRSYDLAEVL